MSKTKTKKMENLCIKSLYKVFALAMFICLATSGYAQELTVKGHITDAQTREAIPGVTIVVKGTGIGTITDANGNYSLGDVPQDALLVFSFVGLKTQEIPVAGQTTIDVKMEPETIGLGEVVAIGYGTVKKRDLTGSVGSVTSESLVERGTTNPLQAMQGQMAGVQITTSTGRIGDGFNITIRGKNTMEDAEPLYIVDGVPTDGIDFLNPQDIERIDALKDASSCAIYGSRGSNGVVIITTKSGAKVKGRFSVNYNGYYGVRTAARLPEMMDPQKWWYYHQSAYLATANVDPELGYVTEETLYAAVINTNNSLLEQRIADNESFDWYDAVLKTGRQQNHFVNFSGSGESGISYDFGIGYQDETGNIDKESIKKYTFKTSIFHKVSPNLELGATFSGSLSEQEMGSNLAMQEAFRLNPFLFPYDEDGNLIPQPGKVYDENGHRIIDKTSTYNPLLEIENSSNNDRRWNGIGNAFLQYKPLNWLSFKTSFNIGYDQLRNGRFWGALTNTGVSNGNLPSSDKTHTENFNYTWDNQIDINREFKDHSFAFTGVQSIYSSKYEQSYLYSRYQPFETGFNNLGSGEQSTFNLSSDYIKRTLASFSLRLNYSYKGKYLLTLSNRWDGSSLFSEGNKWDSFPSGAIGWRIVEENFMQNMEAVSNLKLRVSYGFTGNNVVAPYSTVNKLDTQTYYEYNGTTANGWLPSTIANATLRWEKTQEINLGLDYGIFNNRVSGTIDVYNRLSDDLLMSQELPRESGWDDMQANVGSVRNKGIELMLTTVNIDNKNLKWETSFTFTKNKNKIVSIYGQKEADDIANNLFIGESIDAQYNYKFDGIWQANEIEEAQKYGQTEGQAKVVDQNNDGKITAALDRMILGSSDPDWIGSLSSRLTYKNFDFSFNIYTSQGSFDLSWFHSNFVNTYDRGRSKLNIADWYIPENHAGLEAQASNKYPQPRNEGTYWNNSNVGYYRDASFVKVQNISLGYSFAPSLLTKLHMKRCRIYTNILNPFVFTDYDGYDPEWAGVRFNQGGVSSIVYQFGVNVSF